MKSKDEIKQDQIKVQSKTYDPRKRCERYRGHRKADSDAEHRIRRFLKSIPKRKPHGL